MKVPSTEEEWRSVSKQFEQMWNFSHCVGAIDDKHIIVQAPANCGSTYYNYKGTHSICLMAVCDVHYRFILVDDGDSGQHSDGEVLSNASFGQPLVDGTLPLPKDCPLPGTTAPNFPYVIVGDVAFPLKKNLLRPYRGKNLEESKSIFNYQLRRVIENSFGILAARLCIFCRHIQADPDNVVIFTKAAIALYNYLRTTESTVYCPTGFTDGEDGFGNVIPGSWRREEGRSDGLEPLHQAGGNRWVLLKIMSNIIRKTCILTTLYIYNTLSLCRYSTTAASIQDQFRSYFNSSAGEVSWQHNHIQHTMFPLYIINFILSTLSIEHHLKLQIIIIIINNHFTDEPRSIIYHYIKFILSSLINH